jgi:uncharacterized protein YceK
VFLTGFSFGVFVTARLAKRLADAGIPARRLVLVGTAAGFVESGRQYSTEDAARSSPIPATFPALIFGVHSCRPTSDCARTDGAANRSHETSGLRCTAGKPPPSRIAFYRFSSCFSMIGWFRSIRSRKLGFHATVTPLFVEGKAMKADVVKWVVIVLLSVLASGCSSIRARTGTLDNKEWTVYPGIRQDMKEMGDVFSGERPGRGWLNGLVASILVLDLPFSAVFDTMAVPYDLYRIYTPKASGEARESSRRPSDQQAKDQEPERRR